VNDWRDRLREGLEPVLGLKDPRPKMSAYHNLPCAIFHYLPEDEFELRREMSLLSTRLNQKGKVVVRISLAECLHEALAEQAPVEKLADAERNLGVAVAVETVHEVLASYCPLVDLVAKRMPKSPDPLRHIVFITRAGALFPVYRAFPLLEQLQGRIEVPTVLFYPGVLDGAAGLKFMGILEPEHNYRPKIF